MPFPYRLYVGPDGWRPHPTLSRKKHPMSKPSRVKLLAITMLGIVTGVVGYSVMSAPDRRTADEKFGDAVYDLSYGVDDAAGQPKNSTADEKLDDTVINAANDFKTLRTGNDED